jgi:hypothetical protein
MNAVYFEEKKSPTYRPIGEMEGRVWEASKHIFKGGLGFILIFFLYNDCTHRRD